MRYGKANVDAATCGLVHATESRGMWLNSGRVCASAPLVAGTWIVRSSAVAGFVGREAVFVLRENCGDPK